MSIEYWETLHRDGGLRSVGQSALTDALNVWLYRIGARELDTFSTGLDLTEVFDAAAGTGYWTAHWLERGASRVDGCDLVPLAVDRLTARFGATGRFVVADLTAVQPPTTRSYSTVTAMNVLLHLIDDGGFVRALGHLAGLVASGGHLLIAEPVMLHDPPWVAATSRTRSLEAYTAVLGPLGLDLVRIAPTTVLGADPIEARTALERRVTRTSWALVHRADARGLGGAVGRLLYALDPLMRRTNWAPSGKFLLFRRREPR